MFLPDAHPNPVCCVPLFPRCLLITLQNPSMNSRTGPNFGLLRAGVLRPGGIALANAWRTVRRCVFSFFATALDRSRPNRYSRRISSNSSTLRLLSIGLPVLHADKGRPISMFRVGPNQMIKVGPNQSSEIRSSGRSRRAGPSSRISRL